MKLTSFNGWENLVLGPEYEVDAYILLSNCGIWANNLAVDASYMNACFKHNGWLMNTRSWKVARQCWLLFVLLTRKGECPLTGTSQILAPISSDFRSGASDCSSIYNCKYQHQHYEKSGKVDADVKTFIFVRWFKSYCSSIYNCKYKWNSQFISYYSRSENKSLILFTL